MLSARQGFFSAISNVVGKLMMSRSTTSYPSTTGLNAAYGVTLQADGSYQIIYYPAGTAQYSSIVQFDLDGNVLWQKQTGSTGISFLHLITDSSTQSYVFALNGSDSLIFKFNSSGTLVWQKQITNFTINQVAFNTSKTKFYIAGQRSSSTRLVIINTNGDILNQYSYTGTGIGGIQVDSSDNYYIYGGYPTALPSGIVSSGYIVKYNSSNVQQWRRGFGIDTQNLVVQNLQIDGNGNVYGLVSRVNSSNVNLSTCLVKYDSAGNYQYFYTIMGSLPGLNNNVRNNLLLEDNNSLYVSINTTNTNYQTLIGKLSISSTPSYQWINYLRTSNTVNTSVQFYNEFGLNDANLALSGFLTVSGVGYGYFAQLPKDGSNTGTIVNSVGSFIYANASSVATVSSVATTIYGLAQTPVVTTDITVTTSAIGITNGTATFVTATL